METYDFDDFDTSITAEEFYIEPPEYTDLGDVDDLAGCWEDESY